ncbi:MAG: hypothetical protein P4L64_15235 [Caulobacteraceae bacterium]|nr:hypothetical protein [Caulobacteraceae bacterium]
MTVSAVTVSAPLAWAGPAGLVAASLLWLVFGAHTHALGQLDQIDQRLAAIGPPQARASLGQDDAAARALATPLFALTTGPGAVSDVPIRLEGLAITPGRKAALVAINGKPAKWMAVGASEEGVTVMDVQSSKVTLDTATGFKEVGLWDKAAGPDGAGPAPPPNAASTPTPSPQGFHLPPPIPSGPRK